MSDARELGFGEAVRVLRRARGLTQAAFAAIVGTDQSHISAIERDAVGEYQSTYDAVVHALGFTYGVEVHEAAADVLANSGPSRRKRCPGCGRRRALSAFNRSSANADQRQGWCRDCTARATREWRERNPKHQAAYNRCRRVRPAAKRCAVCGASFTPLRRDGKYCSGPCKWSEARRVRALTRRKVS